MIIAKYKFTTSIDTIPNFNSGYVYNIEDVDNGDGTTTRTILSENPPTSISFSSKTGLLEVYELNISNLSSIASMFSGCENLTHIYDIENWDTSNISNMGSIFQSCKKLQSLDCSRWKVDKVTSMYGMFYACDAITSVGDLSEWNVSSATDFGFMFRRCGKLKDIGNISNWNVSKSSGFRYMFFQSGITSIDMSNWVFDEEKTSTINFSGMFGDCKSLVEIKGVERFPMHRGTTIQQMFYNCTGLKELNLKSWDVSKVTSMQQAFSGCSALTSLDLSSWNINPSTQSTNLFTGNSNLASITLNECSIDTINFFINALPTRQETSKGKINVIVEKESLSNIDTTVATSKFWDIVNRFMVAKYIFNSEIDTIPTLNFSNYQYIDRINEDNTTAREIYHTASPTKINFNGKTGLLEIEFLDMSNISDVQQMFYNCTSLTKVNTDNWNLSKVTNTSNMFRGCSVLTELDLSELNLGNVTNMQSMFNKCSVLTTIGDTSSWNVSKVTSMNYMFEGCSSLKQLNVSNWDVGKLKTMTQTFDGCVALTELDVSNWNTESLTSPSMAFSNCSVLTVIDVSNWNVSSVTTMLNMFSGCSSLAEINLSKWDISSLINTGNMFNKCSSLKSLDISNLDMSKITNSNNMFNATNLRKVKLLDNPISTIERIVNLLPAKKTGDVGYLFVREECPNAKNWESIICKKTTQSILLPQQLNKTQDVADILYWDADKRHYCIEQKVNSDYTVLDIPLIIDLPYLNEKYFLDAYAPKTCVTCSDLHVKPSKILIETDKPKYKPTKLENNMIYTVQFECKEKSDVNIKFDLGGAEEEIEATIGINHLTITTPMELSSDRLFISGEGNVISNVMLVKGEMVQYPNYFDGVLSTGELQEDGSYKISIYTNSETTSYKIDIFSKQPLMESDKLYWSLLNKRYEIERNGEIEVPIVVGDIIDLPRLYQKEDTYFNITVGNIKPSKTIVNYLDID